MKTLDEVIKAYEICTQEQSCSLCPYIESDTNGKWACSLCGDCTHDALHYLKTIETTENLYHDAVNELSKWKDENWKDRCLPLTWDELKQMKGKPVWVEVLEATDSDFVQYRWGNGAWYIVKDFVLGALAEYCQLTPNRRTWTKQSYGKEWQAYRKERDEREQ